MDKNHIKDIVLFCSNNKVENIKIDGDSIQISFFSSGNISSEIDKIKPEVDDIELQLDNPQEYERLRMLED